jgi:hypothetical protein
VLLLDFLINFKKLFEEFLNCRFAIFICWIHLDVWVRILSSLPALISSSEMPVVLIVFVQFL